MTKGVITMKEWESIFIKGYLETTLTLETSFAICKSGAQHQGRGALFLVVKGTKVDYEYKTLEMCNRDKETRRRVRRLFDDDPLTMARRYDPEKEFILLTTFDYPRVRNSYHTNFVVFDEYARTKDKPCKGKNCDCTRISVFCADCDKVMYCSDECRDDPYWRHGPCMGQDCDKWHVSVPCPLCDFVMYCSQECLESSCWLHYTTICSQFVWPKEIKK